MLNNHKTTLYLPKELLKLLKIEAIDENTTMNTLILNILITHFENKHKITNEH